MEKTNFIKILTKLFYSIERHHLPEFSDEVWIFFKENPTKFFLRSNEKIQDLIWSKVKQL